MVFISKLKFAERPVGRHLIYSDNLLGATLKVADLTFCHNLDGVKG